MKVRFFVRQHFRFLPDSTIAPDKKAAHFRAFSHIRGFGSPRKVGPEAILRGVVRSQSDTVVVEIWPQAVPQVSHFAPSKPSPNHLLQLVLIRLASLSAA